MIRVILLSFLLLCLSSCKKKTTIETFTIAFGSCNHQWDEDQPIWEKIAEQEPDLWIWLGDIIYADTEDMSKMKGDYDHQKSHKDYQVLKDNTSIIGIWDDHDYGANNSGKDYEKKDSSKALLLSFLDVPSSHDVWSRPGAYQAYNYTFPDFDMKIILLDVRYFREEPGEDSTIIGEEQWKWLESELASSSADIHIIGGGSQFLPEDHRFEKWANYPKDRSRLIRLLDKHDVDLPILLSGDRHLAEMSLVKDEDDMPILEVTSSGLTHSYRQFTQETNRHRVGGEVIPVKNFGVLRITSIDGQVGYTAGLYNSDGVLQYQLENTELSELID